MLTGLRMSITIVVVEELMAEAFYKVEEEEIGLVAGIMHSLEIIKAKVAIVLIMPITLVLTMVILVIIVASLMEKVF